MCAAFKVNTDCRRDMAARLRAQSGRRIAGSKGRAHAATDGERAQGLESLAAIGKEPSNRLAVMVVFSSAEIDGAHASNHRLPGGVRST